MFSKIPNCLDEREEKNTRLKPEIVILACGLVEVLQSLVCLSLCHSALRKV